MTIHYKTLKQYIREFLYEQQQIDQKRLLLRSNIELIFKARPGLREGLSDLIRIPILMTNKVKKYIGSGMHGDVFLLDNDHVFKIFESSSGNVPEEDLEYYKRLQDKQFAGKGTRQMPAIYDFGNSGFLYYVEMGKVLPIYDWFDLTKRKRPTLYNFYNFERKIFDILELDKLPRGGNKKQVVNKFKQIGLNNILNHFNKDEIEPLTIEELKAFIKAWFVAYANTSSRNIDINPGNIGVLIQNPKEWVIFDI